MCSSLAILVLVLTIFLCIRKLFQDNEFVIKFHVAFSFYKFSLHFKQNTKKLYV